MPLKEYHLAPSTNFEIDDVEDDSDELGVVDDYRSSTRRRRLMCGKSCHLCRFTWRPRLLAVLLALALVLSIVASLYCDFLSVTLGFVPQGYAGDVVGIALWSFEGPDMRCHSFRDAYELGGLSIGDESYSNWIANGDIAWTVARVLAMAGVVFGTIALVCMLLNLCENEPHVVDVLAYTVVIALVSEAAKLGLFFKIDLCVSANFWHSNEIDEYMGSTCGMSQGAFICIGSMVVYFISGVLLILYCARPKIDDYNYDENSLAEMTATIAGKTLSTQATSFQRSQKSQPSAWTSDIRREGSHMSSHVGPYSTKSFSDRRQSSQGYCNEAVEEGDDDVMQPLPQFHGSSKPRLMDDMSAVTMDP